MIDITKPLELSDGTRVEYRDHAVTGAGWVHVTKAGREWFFIVENGLPHPAWIKEAAGRTLRNVRPVLTGVECVERMEALVRRMAQQEKEHADAPTCFCYSNHAEAREIVAMLPPAADHDLLEARSVAARIGQERGYTHTWRAECLNGQQDENEYVIGALAGIAKGRELERGE